MKLVAAVTQGAPLLAIPLSLVPHHWKVTGPTWIFLARVLAIAVLADWVRRGTEQVAPCARATPRNMAGTFNYDSSIIF
jgi:Ca2+/H+ antiporter